MINVLCENKENITNFHLKIIIFSAVKNCSTLHYIEMNDKIIRILHYCLVRIEKSAPRVTVWHHEALPSDAQL